MIMVFLCTGRSISTVPFIRCLVWGNSFALLYKDIILKSSSLRILIYNPSLSYKLPIQAYNFNFSTYFCACPIYQWSLTTPFCSLKLTMYNTTWNQKVKHNGKRKMHTKERWPHFLLYVSDLQDLWVPLIYQLKLI